MYFFEEPPYKRISNQIVEVRCFSGAAIGDIYFYFDSIVKGKIAALILHRGNIAKRNIISGSQKNKIRWWPLSKATNQIILLYCFDQMIDLTMEKHLSLLKD